MNRGPMKTQPKTDFNARALACWGSVPDWVEALADACSATNLSAVAKQLDYSPATVSQTLSNSYRGDLGRVEEMVRGALMSAVVDCPILGEIGRDRCLTEQDEPFRATSAMRAQLYHACRGGCPFSKHTKGSDHGSDA